MNASRSITPNRTPTAAVPPPPRLTGAQGPPLLPPATLLTPSGPVRLVATTVVMIGREYSCDLVLEDNLASRRHARVVSTPHRIVIEEVSSRNGVFVNGVRIHRTAVLCVGDRILLGTTELSVF
jgi:pSer/pThr/pTyr-binding forkhead associated (FHA) protein